MENRLAEIHRKTRETDVRLFLDLDREIGSGGEGPETIQTGIGFLDHMLILFARHSGFGLLVEAAGDTHVDCHHTMEDVGIVLGSAIAKAAGTKEGIARYGSAVVPMDEALVMVVVDLGGRPYYAGDAVFFGQRIGEMDTQMMGEFFKAVAFNGLFNLHIQVIRGGNDHHVAEAIFKAFGRALAAALTRDPRVQGVLSTKGVL
ncbi:MAG TPA: imidazoleglycerol-phosphate dehydratase HisB [Clostridiales bacterium]|nr:imidazoleglycerol-phosphate dehydratase HisB [Clostridiales bacterium]